jgi:arylsulfatase A-like enzyme
MRFHLFLLILSGLWIPCVSPAAEAPNVLLILADDLGWGDLGCYPKGSAWGDEAHVPTPNLDRLAARGVLCTEAYATGMVCCPSRAGLMAGRYQTHLGYYSFGESTAPFPKVELMPEALRGLGYATALCGKWHVSLAPGSRPMERGFEHFFGILAGQHDYFEPNLGQPCHGVENSMDAPVWEDHETASSLTYLTHDLTTRAIQRMGEAREAKKPFFVYLAYTAPHPPLQALWVDLEPYAQKRENGRFNSRDIVRAMIAALDRDIGRLLKWLNENGVEGNTLVVFSSDNGGHDDGPGKMTQHNGGLRGRKGFFWEGGIRVPLLISWPAAIPAGKIYRHPVSHLDLYPTFLAAAGKPVPDKQFDGVNLLPHLQGAKVAPPHDRLFWSLGDMKRNWAVREGAWKIVRESEVPAPGKRVDPKTLKTRLYNLEDDPHEQHDVSEKERSVFKRLEGEIQAFHERVKPSVETEEVKAANRRILAERDPALATVPRTDGAPGHWIGPGAAARMQAENLKARTP